MPKPSNRNAGGHAPEALVAITDVKPRRRRTGADVKAEWAPTDRIVFEPEREAITGFKRQWYYEKEKKGEVPRRMKLGARRVGWLLSELEAWVRERAAARDAGGGNAQTA